MEDVFGDDRDELCLSTMVTLSINKSLGTQCYRSLVPRTTRTDAERLAGV
jgi:hypothetical protein